MNTDSYESFIGQLQDYLIHLPGCSGEAVRILRKGYTCNDEKEMTVIHQCNKLFCSREDVLQGDVMIAEKEEGEITTAMRVNLKKEYETYLDQGMDVVKQENREAWERVNASEPDVEMMKKRVMGSYEEVKKNLIVRPLNHVIHRFDLKDAVYQVMCGDVSLVLYQIISDEGGILATSRIVNEDLKRWHMMDRKDEIMQEALVNTSRLYPAVVASQKHGGEEVEFLRARVTRQDMTFCGMIMLSARKTPNGAAAIFYPGVRQKMLNIMHGPYYVVFVNTCDVLIFRENDVKLHNALHLASKCNGYGEVLSGQCYRCDAGKIRAVRAA